MSSPAMLANLAVSTSSERSVLARIGVWMLLSTIYGFLFTCLSTALPVETRGITIGLVVPATAAAAWVALIYGSMRLTVLGGLYAMIAVILCFLFEGAPAILRDLLIAGGFTGAGVGALYGIRVRDSRVFRADAKTLAGACAGLLASSAVALPAALGTALPLPLQTLILCPLTGLLYLGVAPGCVARFSRLLPRVGDGILVGMAAGALMGLAFWVMAGTLGGNLSLPDQGFVDGLLVAWPGATGAAALGGLMVALGRAALRIRWYDL